MSEGILRHLVQQHGSQDKWIIDSAGIADWQVGNPPDERAMQVLEKNGITGYRKHGHIARQITFEDFNKFDYILTMDDGNIRDLNRMKPKGSTANIELLGKYDPKKQSIIDDPFYGYHQDRNAFHKVYHQCLRSIQAFRDVIERRP